MPSSQTQLGHSLARFLGIKLEAPENSREDVTRGESILSQQTTDTFVEEQPTTAEWLQEITPTGADVAHYFKSLFPFLSWIGFYNLQWLFGDLVAGQFFCGGFCAKARQSPPFVAYTVLGITIGAVVVPQGMAYAKLANLPVEFGLYSSFMGVLIYWFFATSKDITIGVSKDRPYLIVRIILTIHSLARCCSFHRYRKRRD